MQIDRLEFKAAFTADETGVVTGKAWDFSSPDRVGDVIEPAAFAGAVGKSLPMLFAHDQAQAVGVWDGIAVESDGLKVTGKLLVDEVARAREVRALLQAKAVTGLSVGFMTKKAAPRKGGGRTISDLDLVEVSLVAVPAHDGARVSTVKDLNHMTNTAAAPAAPEKTEEKTAPAVDQKALDAIQKRLDAIEAAGNRLSADNDNDAPFDTKAISDWARTGKLNGVEEKTLTIGADTGATGDNIIAPEYSTSVITKLTEMNPIRQLSNVITVGSQTIYIPVLDSDAEGTWVSETGNRTEDQPAFDQVQISNHEHAVIVGVSNQLLDDSVIDLASFIANRAAMMFAKAEATAFLTGSGTGEPAGIIEALSDLGGKTEGTDILEDIVDVYYSLPSAYAARGSWLLSRPTIAAIRKAADLSDNRNGIWSDSLQVGTPARLLGAPVYEAPGLDTYGSTSTGNVGASALFGDFSSGFTIADRRGMRLVRDPYTAAGQGITKFHFSKRVGSAVVLPEAIVALKAA